jgi:hypothetical protein
MGFDEDALRAYRDMLEGQRQVAEQARRIRESSALPVMRKARKAVSVWAGQVCTSVTNLVVSIPEGIGEVRAVTLTWSVDDHMFRGEYPSQNLRRLDTGLSVQMQDGSHWFPANTKKKSDIS